MKRRSLLAVLLAPLVAPFASRLGPKQAETVMPRETRSMAYFKERYPLRHEEFHGSTRLYQALTPEAGSPLDDHMRHTVEHLEKHWGRE